MQKEEKDCFLQSPAYAPSELILIVFDKGGKKKKKGKRKRKIARSTNHRHLVKRKQLRLNMTHPKANKSIKPRMFLKQPGPPPAQLLNCILLTSQLTERNKTEGGDTAWICA